MQLNLYREVRGSALKTITRMLYSVVVNTNVKFRINNGLIYLSTFLRFLRFCVLDAAAAAFKRVIEILRS